MKYRIYREHGNYPYPGKWRGVEPSGEVTWHFWAWQDAIDWANRCTLSNKVDLQATDSVSQYATSQRAGDKLYFGTGTCPP